jgi:DNA-binding NarL/FixJ family response regulator
MAHQSPSERLAHLDRLGRRRLRVVVHRHAVAAMILAGHSNCAIARERGTSPRTVVSQTAAIFRKLGVASRRELVARFG